MDFIGIKKVMLALGAVATVVIFFRQAGTMAATSARSSSGIGHQTGLFQAANCVVRKAGSRRR